MVNPVPGYRVTYAYGTRHSRYQKGYHTGSDISAPEGTPVVAAQPGTVVKAGRGVLGSSLGIAVVVRYTNGQYGRFCHLDSECVNVGQNVKAGQKIGTVGTTGTNSSGPHLHYELGPTAEWGRDVNPTASINWQEAPSKGTWAVDTTALNIRSGPGATNRLVGTIKRNHQLKILGTKGSWGWYKTGDGQTRWAHLGYMRKVK